MASSSGHSLSCASPPRSEACAPQSRTMAGNEPSDRKRGVAVAFASDEAAAQLEKRQDDVGDSAARGDGKRVKSVLHNGVPGPVELNNDGRLQLASEEPQSLLFSCHPTSTGAASARMLCPSRITQSVQRSSLFRLDGPKHKIFLSHSGAQKDFVEQLCVDLERHGYFFPFFDQRCHSLPGGKDFAPLIMEAAQLCHVAVIVLSKEFLSSKWPMIELAEFHAAQEAAREGERKLEMLPLFFKLSVEDVKDEDRWMLKWKQHASDDKRIDVRKWSAAVKALCKRNGLEFGKVPTKEVAYRESVVQLIFRLSPPDLLYGSAKKVVGYDRMCEEISSQFVGNTKIGAPVVGLFGMVGLGKTTLSKALCDYFYGEFLGKVCHVELGKLSRAKRQELILKTLCGFESIVLDRIRDEDKGLTQMEVYMKREPVFLVIDNVINDDNSIKEARDYLMAGFHPKSRIMITSRSKETLQDLQLLDLECIMPMPKLRDEEAGVLFLKHFAPMKCISVLTSEERWILQICIEKCWFYSFEEGGSYHPLALSALADLFSRSRRPKDNGLLLWKNHVGENMVSLKDVWRSSKGLFDILGLQFSTFDLSEKLLFLDIALFGIYWVDEMESNIFMGVKCNCASMEEWVEWLCVLYEETPTIVEKKIWDLKKSGMIEWDDDDFPGITVPGLYREFAEWYVTKHEVKGMRNSWRVFQTAGTSLRGNSLTCWSDLVRLRIFDLTAADARLVASKAMQKLSNLEVLQLHFCTNMVVLNLEGLDCLRHLELVRLTKLVTIMLPENSSTCEYAGMYDSLRYVAFVNLESLTDVPDFRSCTSLQSVRVDGCSKLRHLEGLECPELRVLRLYYLVPHQFDWVSNFKSLQSLVSLKISAHISVHYFEVEWVRKTVDTEWVRRTVDTEWVRRSVDTEWVRTRRTDTVVEDDEGECFRGEGPCHRLLQVLRPWNRLSCTDDVDTYRW